MLARVVFESWRAAGISLISWRELQPVLHDELAHLVEEAYELIDAIDAGSPDKLKEELADLFFHIIFHCQIADRFKKVEMELAAMGKDIEKCTLEEMDAVWNKVKNKPEARSEKPEARTE